MVFVLVLCGSRKYPYPPILRGGGSQKPKFLKESMNQNWKFQGGGRVQTKKPSLGEVWIFFGTTHYSRSLDHMTSGFLGTVRSKMSVKAEVSTYFKYVEVWRRRGVTHKPT